MLIGGKQRGSLIAEELCRNRPEYRLAVIVKDGISEHLNDIGARREEVKETVAVIVGSNGACLYLEHITTKNSGRIPGGTTAIGYFAKIPMAVVLKKSIGS
jgi:hypothetical protein